MKFNKNIFVYFLIIFIFIELFSLIFTKANLLLFNETPLIYKSTKDNTWDWRTGFEKWGSWHKPNSSAIHERKCFLVTLESNEIGARDDKIKDIPGKNYILLGDSFAEGYGVNLEDTSQFLIEQNNGINIINLGSAGWFGPLQYLLVYKNFKDQFKHKGVIIYLLPANDFTDNDSDHWKKIDSRLYRPYFGKIGNVLEPYYFPNSIKRETLNIDFGRTDTIKKFIKKYFWSANVLRTIRVLLRKDTTFSLSSKNSLPYSGYYDAKLSQQISVFKALNKIINLADGKKVNLVVIPSQNDIKRHQNGFEYEDLYWFKTAQSFKLQYPNFNFIDLMLNVDKSYKNLFYECDKHWSPNGNKWAADVISSKLN